MINFCVSSNKRYKQTLSIDQLGGSTNFANYDASEEQRFSISSIVRKDEDNNERKIFSSKIISGEHDVQKVVDFRTKSTEEIQGALSESSMMLTATSMLISRENLGYLTHNQRSLNSSGEEISENKMTRGIELPVCELIEIFGQDLVEMSSLVALKRERSCQTVQERKIFLSGIKTLRKSWRLLDSSHSNWPGSTSTKKSEVAIDCSFVSVGDEASSLKGNLVSLVPSLHGPTVLLTESSRQLQTLRLSLLCNDSNAGTRLCLASVLAWKNEALEQSDHSNLEFHLVGRHHDSFCRRLFAFLRQDAAVVNEKWTVNHSLLNSAFSSTGHVNAVLNERLCPRLHLQQVGRRLLSLFFSSSLTIDIELVDQPQSFTPVSSCQEFLPNPHVPHWVHESLSIALLSTQLTLLNHFSRNLHVAQTKRFNHFPRRIDINLLQSYQNIGDKSSPVRTDIAVASSLKIESKKTSKKEFKSLSETTMASLSSLESTAHLSVGVIENCVEVLLSHFHFKRLSHYLTECCRMFDDTTELTETTTVVSHRQTNITAISQNNDSCFSCCLSLRSNQFSLDSGVTELEECTDYGDVNSFFTIFGCSLKIRICAKEVGFSVVKVEVKLTDQFSFNSNQIIFLDSPLHLNRYLRLFSVENCLR